MVTLYVYIIAINLRVTSPADLTQQYNQPVNKDTITSGLKFSDSAVKTYLAS